MRKDKLKRIKRISSTERIVRKRIRIIKEGWYSEYKGFLEEHPWVRIPGRLKKYNLRCGCKMCSFKNADTVPLRDKKLNGK